MGMDWKNNVNLVKFFIAVLDYRRSDPPAGRQTEWSAFCFICLPMPIVRQAAGRPVNNFLDRVLFYANLVLCVN